MSLKSSPSRRAPASRRTPARTTKPTRAAPRRGILSWLKGSSKPATEKELPFASAAWAPPAEVQVLLGSIDASNATPVAWSGPLKGLTFMGQLPGGELIMETDLDTDADGSPNYKKLDPHFGRPDTAYTFPGIPDGYMNAETVPYFVMPKTPAPDGTLMFRKLGLEKGDIAAVMWNGRLAFAVFGDAGPDDKIGEGSIRLVESLGFDPFNSNHEVIRGISGKVVTIVFPQSRMKDLKPATAEAQIIARGTKFFSALGGRTETPRSLRSATSRRAGRAPRAAARAAAPAWSETNTAHRVTMTYLMTFYATKDLRDDLLAMPYDRRFAYVGTRALGDFDYFTSQGTPAPIASGNIYEAAVGLVKSANEWGARWGSLKESEAATKLAAVMTDKTKTVADLGNTLAALATF